MPLYRPTEQKPDWARDTHPDFDALRFWPGDGTPSLSRFVASYIYASPHRRLIGRLDPDESNRRLGPDKAGLVFREPRERISGEDAQMIARKIGKALLPPILLHQESFNGRLAQISVSLNGRPPQFPDEVIGVNLNDLEKAITAKYTELGESVHHSTLYVVQVAGQQYKFAVTRGTLDQDGWDGYDKWRDILKREFGVHITLRYDSGRIPEFLSLTQPSKQYTTHPTTVITAASPPPKLGRRDYNVLLRSARFAENWIGRTFLSTDSSTIQEPEDIISFRATQGGTHIRYLVPFSPSQIGSFKQGKLALGIGTDSFLQHDGHCRTNRVAIAVAVNKRVLHSAVVRDVLERIAVNEKRERSNLEPLALDQLAEVRRIENNPAGLGQIRSLRRVAGTCMKMRLDSGAVVSVPLNLSYGNGETLTSSKRESMVPEAAVYQITKFAQRAFAEWMAEAETPVPFVALRPVYAFGDEFLELQRALPDIRESDLADPSKRLFLCEQLRANGRNDLLNLVGAAIGMSRSGHKLVVVDSRDDLRIDDVAPFKRAHRRLIIGGVNQVQATSALVPGSPCFSSAELHDYVVGLNSAESKVKEKLNRELTRRIEDVTRHLFS